MLFGKNVNRYYFKFGGFFLIGIVALITVDWFQLEIPKIIRHIVDGIDQRNLTIEQLTELIQYMIVIAAIMFVGRFLWRICIFGNGIRIEADLRERMFAHSEKLSQSYYQENKTGALMALYTNDLIAVRAAFGRGMIMFIDALFLGVIAFIKMWNLDWLLTLVSSVPLILIALCGGIIGNYMRKKFRIRQKSYADLSDFTQESFSGLSVVRAFVNEGKELLQFRKRNTDYREKNLDFVKASTLLNILIGVLIASVNIIVITYGGYLIYQGTLIGGTEFTIGNLTEFIAYFGTLTWPMMAIGMLINLRSQAKASLQRIDELLDHKVEIEDHPGVLKNRQIEGKISFKNLNFKFPNTDKYVLENINFTINKGESVGIIGRTGSGKTTLVDLLLRIYNIDKEQLFIDDIDIMNLPFRNVRQAIAYVPQDNFLFSDSILNNINFYSQDIDKKEIIRSAKMSDVHDNIKEFYLGYDTVLGERGVTISGGQKQRISIARALIKDAQILILDDSVSAVDTKTEEKILENLRNIRIGKTTIIIAHRISTIQTLDKIVLIDKGKIVGVGSHEQLLAQSKLYQKMVHLQTLEKEVEGEQYE